MFLAALLLSATTVAEASLVRQQSAVSFAAGDAEGQEVVVTARRTGIPVWSVEGPRGTLVLVSSISPLAPGTKWEPGSLTSAVSKADRVLFLNGAQGSASPFQAVGWYLKFRNRATLPKGQTLRQMLPPQDLQRLSMLERRGVLKTGWDRRNPLHLSIELRNRTQGKMKEVSGASGYVRAAARTYKRPMVPLRSVALGPLAKRFFALPPSAFVPCLRDSIALAEAGSGVFKARSDAWAQRRVRDVLSYPGGSGDILHCGPPEIRDALAPDLRPTIRRLAGEPGTTLAVVDLKQLAETGGILDSLVAAGHRVRGPAWK